MLNTDDTNQYECLATLYSFPSLLVLGMLQMQCNAKKEGVIPTSDDAPLSNRRT
jgi:hypothetical protein